MKHVYTEVHATHLTGQEKIFHFLSDEGETFSQLKARDERSTEEIINEDNEIPTFWSQIYHTFQ